MLWAGKCRSFWDFKIFEVSYLTKMRFIYSDDCATILTAQLNKYSIFHKFIEIE